MKALEMLGRLGKATVVPEFAFVMDTRESKGFLIGQTVRADVTEQISKEDLLVTRVEAMPTVGNVVHRNELVVCFAAKAINRLEGYYLFKLGSCSGGDTGAVLLVDQAYLQKAGHGWQFVVKAKSDGMITLQVLYSRNPEMRRVWLVDSTNVFGPQPSDFLYAYPLNGNVASTLVLDPQKEWQSMVLELDSAMLAAAVRMDWCLYLLEYLNNLFTAPEGAFIWIRSWIRSEIIQEIIQKSGVRWKTRVLIITEQGMRIPVGETDFVPLLRQKIALKNNDGSLTGAEVWIGISEGSGGS